MQYIYIPKNCNLQRMDSLSLFLLTLLYMPDWMVPKSTLMTAQTAPWLWIGLRAPG